MVLYDYDKNMQLTENFNISEFHCKDGNAVPFQYVMHCWYIARQLEKLRVSTGAIKINSAYRTSEHNRKIGGATNSNHLRALAVDIKPLSITYEKFKLEFQSMVQSGQIPSGEIYYYDDKKFIHYAPNLHLKHILFKI